MLIKYIRDDNYKPIGVIVAIDAENVGYAFCNPRDRWNKGLAKEIAIGRALSGSKPPIPNRQLLSYNKDTGLYDYISLEDLTFKLVERMRERAKAYFKPSGV